MELEKGKKSVPLELLREIVCFLPLNVEFADKRISYIFDLFILKIHHRLIVYFRKILNSFKLGVGEAILALNSLNITVLDGVNVQQISVILDDMWTIADFWAVQLGPLSQAFSGSFNDLSTTWNANNNDEQNGNGEDALNGLRTRITTKISILVDVFVITINVGNGFLGLLNQHFLRRALERVQQKTNMLRQFFNNEENIDEVENDENVPP
uniref:Uncharacterized protein n=1 Tax=Meloidogyne incognita TaxID=6306 RepID=A0A914KGE8_MELIC